MSRMRMYAPLLLVLSHVSFAQWSMTAGPYDIRTINVIGTSGNFLFAGIEGGGVFMSEDNGSSWVTIGKGLTNAHILSFVTMHDKVYVGTQTGVFQLNNSDLSWTILGPFGNYIWALAANDTVLFAGTSGSGIYRSPNYGSSWTVVNSGLGDMWIKALVISKNTIFAGTQSHGVYRSTNNGDTWTPASSGLGNPWIVSLAASETTIFAGTSDGTYYSTNGGTAWSPVDSSLPGNVMALCLVANGTNVFAGTAGKGVFVSTNGGNSWTASNYGMGETWISSIAMNNTYLFAGTSFNWIWRRPLDQVTSVARPVGATPVDISLQQNYPNPFNPSTTIRFSLDDRSSVRLTVYNTLGQLVSTVVDGIKDAGNYEELFNASQLPSGVYVYRLEAASEKNKSKSFVNIRKMVVMK